LCQSASVIGSEVCQMLFRWCSDHVHHQPTCVPSCTLWRSLQRLKSHVSYPNPPEVFCLDLDKAIHISFHSCPFCVREVSRISTSWPTNLLQRLSCSICAFSGHWQEQIILQRASLLYRNVSGLCSYYFRKSKQRFALQCLILQI